MEESDNLNAVTPSTPRKIPRFLLETKFNKNELNSIEWNRTEYLYSYTYHEWPKHVGATNVTKLHYKTKAHLLVFNTFYKSN